MLSRSISGFNFLLAAHARSGCRLSIIARSWPCAPAGEDDAPDCGPRAVDFRRGAITSRRRSRSRGGPDGRARHDEPARAFSPPRPTRHGHWPAAVTSAECARSAGARGPAALIRTRCPRAFIVPVPPLAAALQAAGTTAANGRPALDWRADECCLCDVRGRLRHRDGVRRSHARGSCYRLSPLTYRLGRRFVHVTLRDGEPRAGRRVVPNESEISRRLVAATPCRADRSRTPPASGGAARVKMASAARGTRRAGGRFSMWLMQP